MAQVRMIAGIGGSTDGIEIPPPGGVVDLPERTAREFVALGYAEAVATGSAVDGRRTATVKATRAR